MPNFLDKMNNLMEKSFEQQRQAEIFLIQTLNTFFQKCNKLIKIENFMDQRNQEQMDLNESPVREYQHFKSFIGSGILEDELLLPDPKKEDEEKITDIIPNQVLIPNHPKPREKNPRDKIILKLMSRQKHRILPKNHRDQLLCYVNTRRGQKGNKNFVKFLIKEFFSHCQEFISEDDYEYRQYLKRMYDQIYKQGPKKIVRKHLQKLIGNEAQGNRFQRRTRLMIADIFATRKFIQKDIFRSSFIKKKADKKQQLLATKVYRLRCRHHPLARRLQSR